MLFSIKINNRIIILLHILYRRSGSSYFTNGYRDTILNFFINYGLLRRTYSIGCLMFILYKTKQSVVGVTVRWSLHVYKCIHVAIFANLKTLLTNVENKCCSVQCNDKQVWYV